MRYKAVVAAKSEKPFDAKIKAIWHSELDFGCNMVWQNRGKKGLYVAIRTKNGCGCLNLHDHAKDIILEQSSLYIIEEERIKSYCPAKKSWEYLWLQFSSDMSFQSYCGKAFLLPITEDEDFAMNLIFQKLTQNNSLSAMAASAGFSFLMSEWLNKLHILDSGQPAELDEVLAYISNNLTKDISVPYLAKIAKMSVSPFRNAFKAYTNKTPSDYIEERRLQTAKILMETTLWSIKTISDFIGYNNQYYFSRRFKNRFGQPPREYRKSKKL